MVPDQSADSVPNAAYSRPFPIRSTGGGPRDSRVQDHLPEWEDLRRPRPDRQHQLPRFGEQRLDHRRLLAPASSAGSSLSRGRSSGSPRSPRSSLRCSASTAPTTRRSATTGGRDRAWHRKRAESTLRPVQVAGSGIGHGGPDSSAGRQAGKLGGLPAIVRYSGQERKSLSYNAVHSVRLFIRQ